MTILKANGDHTRPSHVLVVGAGRIGQALAHLIRSGNSGAAVQLWDNRAGVVPDQVSLVEALRGATIVFYCTPSWALRSALSASRAHLEPAAAIISLCKGLEPESGMTSAEILTELVPDHPWAVLGGPMMAEDLERDLPGHGIVASDHLTIFSMIEPLFQGTRLSLEAATQPTAIAVAGVLKNIYALLVGLSVGLHWTATEQQLLLDQAFKEMIDVGHHLNIEDTIMEGTAGVADFIATASNPSSRNRQSGIELATTDQIDTPSEALRSLPPLTKRVDDTRRFPLLQSLIEIVIHHRAAAKVFPRPVASA